MLLLNNCAANYSRSANVSEHHVPTKFQYVFFGAFGPHDDSNRESSAVCHCLIDDGVEVRDSPNPPEP